MNGRANDRCGAEIARSHRGRGTALLLVDWINDFEFPEAEGLLAHALPAARNAARLRERATSAGVPIIYVNDNFGHWRSDFERVVERCRERRGRAIIELLEPRPGDFFVLKPKHSGFLHTPLELLLDHLGVGRLVFTGLAGDICVLFTAHDAHMRDFRVAVARDCVASNTPEANTTVIEQLGRIVHAEIADGDALALPVNPIGAPDSGSGSIAEALAACDDARR
ncbi:MAG TPA: isochorismatase family cysteine hydrolase [Nannocystaceae bacterium]|nr:isochorismatase family cysteine hydrolase [Nannocystaceae bacterium]